MQLWNGIFAIFTKIDGKKPCELVKNAKRFSQFTPILLLLLINEIQFINKIVVMV
jgi:hypothetical protein